MEVGEFPPEDVHLPCVYVQRVALGEKYEKRIEVKKLISTYNYINIDCMYFISFSSETCFQTARWRGRVHRLWERGGAS